MRCALIKAICAKALFSCKILLRSCVLYVSPGASMNFYSSKRTVYVVLTALVLFISGISPALAGAAPTPCDPDYYESLRSRAWLEAQREITQNQNLIVKPDSVLEYTCFDQFMDILAYEAFNMFSETPRWGIVLPPNSMDMALEYLVGGAMRSYLEANYPHRFRGHRSLTLDYIPEPIHGMSGTDYLCTSMRDVWLESKCVDFIEIPDADGFFTFENYRDTPDKRILPEACLGIPDRWAENFDVATVNPFTPWEEDNQLVFFDLLDPANCGGGTLQIETGVIVRRSKLDPVQYREKACLPPGCHYVPSGMNSGSCQN